MVRQFRRRPDEQQGDTPQITKVLGTTAPIDIEELASGLLYLPTGTNVTTLTYFVAIAPGQTYVALYDKNGTAVTQTVSAAAAAGAAFPLHEAAFAAGAVKLIADAGADASNDFQWSVKA